MISDSHENQIGDYEFSSAAAAALIAAALADAGLGTNDGKLRRVDTGAWETVRRSNGVITAVADAGGGVCTVTAAAHGQADGTTVTIAGTTDYNGDYVIANVTTDTFDITETFTSSQTGTFWVAANVYKCPSALACGGAFGTMRVRRFKGFTGGATITIWAASGISRAPVILGGYLLDSATGNTMSLLGYISAGGIGALQISSGDITLKAGTSYDDATDEYDIVLAYVQP